MSKLAEWLGYTRQHVTRLFRAGRIPGAYRSKGKHWRVRCSRELLEWVDENGSLKSPSLTDRSPRLVSVEDELSRVTAELLERRDQLRALEKRGFEARRRLLNNHYLKR